MTSAYERKKQPDVVRRSLLDHGARICLQMGVAGLTLQAVANAAGVTKGGLLHHFPTKQALIEAIFDDMLLIFSEAIEREMERDPERYGRFTRAYIVVLLRLTDPEEANRWPAPTVAMLTDAALQEFWSGWLREQLERHRDTDGDPALAVARYAADGLWLASLAGAVEAVGGERDRLLAHLFKMTFECTGQS